MEDWQERALNILEQLGGAPATSFHEGPVEKVIESTLTNFGIPSHKDQFGNIIAKLDASSTDHTNPETIPAIAFVAHMDHPGFEIVSIEDQTLGAVALGGVPPGGYEPGLSLEIILPDDTRIPSNISTANPEERTINIHLPEKQNIPIPCPAIFNLIDFSIDEDFIRMRALDDLAGCGSILTSLEILKGEKIPTDVYGVFTRAEEVGLVGARLMAEAMILPMDTFVVSLESSRTLPGAEMGEGPVIRVGDAGLTFNTEAETVLHKAKECLQTPSNPVKIQRQLMSGGTCEASAFTLHGYRTTGIAFPLGNYHNGTPDSKIGPEFIHMQDYFGGIQLITEAARQVPNRENTAFRQRISSIPSELSQRLKQ